jgi:DNA-binding GntR family transcriptional regulator
MVSNHGESVRIEGQPSPSAELTPISFGKVASVTDLATQAIRQAILDGRLRPGERLVQDELAASLGVSRQPIREAVRRLESEGLVDGRNHARGLTVRSYSVDDVVENYHLRRLLEAEAARLAASHVSDADIGRLDAILKAMVDTHARGDHVEFSELNRRFHRAIHELSGLPTLLRLIEQLWGGFTVLTPIFIAGRAEESIDEHRDIVAALRERDPQAASQKMIDHIIRASAQYLAAVKDLEIPGATKAVPPPGSVPGLNRRS